MRCNVSAVKQTGSAGRHVGVNVTPCHASIKQVSKHLTSQEKEFEEFTTLLRSLPAEVFAADSPSCYVGPASPAI
jgi:hypothetical protein